LDDKDVNIIVTLKVPSQNNYSDCGVFLLKYAELFSKSPPNNLNEINENMFGKEWFKIEEINQLRIDIKKIIIEANQQDINSSLE